MGLERCHRKAQGIPKFSRKSVHGYLMATVMLKLISVLHVMLEVLFLSFRLLTVCSILCKRLILFKICQKVEEASYNFIHI